MRNHPVLSFLVFTCFLVIGYTLSIRFYQAEGSSFLGSYDKVTTENQPGIAALDNGQRSILMIGASAINGTNPQLESIWLASYFPLDTTIQLLPIYPTGEKSTLGLERQLDQSFSLRKEDGRRQLENGFLDLLEKNNYWWSGYIIYDEVSLAKIFTLLGGIQLNGKTVADSQVLQSVSKVIEDPHNAYSVQIAILQSLCAKFSDINTQPDLTQLMTLFPDHILTDFDANQLQMELEALSSNHNDQTCRFPTLEISRVEP
ncbi:MAG TPA: hypothetical protein VLD65_02630 [Anaerolineales bacterium]|nr:hypothetical protein [Anaerolineales bacterium]